MPAPSRARDAPMRGMALMTLACLMFPVGDAIAKYLVATHNVILIVWLKFLIQTLLVALVIVFTLPHRLFKTRRPFMQIGRGLAGIGSYATFLLAISYIPLADALAIEFSSPMLVVALSVPLLGEKVGMRRWTAVIVGCVGTLLIVRPGLGLVHWAASLMLVAAVCVALMQIISRLLAKEEHPMTSLFYLSLTGLVVSTPPIMFLDNPSFSPTDWGMMLAVGAIAGFCYYLFVRSYEFATASLLAPFIYGQIVGATILGFLIFGDFPDEWTIWGTVVLIGSGLYIAYRENRISATRGKTI